jgi:DNA-binding transcriptional MerR regulator
MSWSTRQIADLAGVTIRAVRYYHETGLLPEPERSANGYKNYRIGDLLTILRIKRLTDLGLTPAKIAEVDAGDTSSAFEILDRELEATITKLERIRSELTHIVHRGAPIDLPSGFTSVRRELTDADRALILLYSRVYDGDTMAAVRAIIDRPETDVEADFDALAADADEQTRADLARRYAAHAAMLRRQHPSLIQPRSVPVSAGEYAITQVLPELYNTAQLDVLARLPALLDTPPDLD